MRSLTSFQLTQFSALHDLLPQIDTPLLIDILSKLTFTFREELSETIQTACEIVLEREQYPWTSLELKHRVYNRLKSLHFDRESPLNQDYPYDAGIDDGLDDYDAVLEEWGVPVTLRPLVLAKVEAVKITCREIAEITGKSENAVWQIFSRLRKKVKNFQN